MSEIPTGCPECGTVMQRDGDQYACMKCGHQGEQGAIELPESTKPKVWREDMLTAEQAEWQIPGYEDQLESSTECLNSLRKQIARIENDMLRGKKTRYTDKDLEDFRKSERWYAADVEKLGRELNERKLLVSGWTWEEIIAQRQPVEEPEEPTLF